MHQNILCQKYRKTNAPVIVAPQQEEGVDGQPWPFWQPFWYLGGSDTVSLSQGNSYIKFCNKSGCGIWNSDSQQYLAGVESEKLSVPKSVGFVLSTLVHHNDLCIKYNGFVWETVSTFIDWLIKVFLKF